MARTLLTSSVSAVSKFGALVYGNLSCRVFSSFHLSIEITKDVINMGEGTRFFSVINCRG